MFDKVLYTKKNIFVTKIAYIQDKILPQPQKLSQGVSVMPVTNSRSGLAYGMFNLGTHIPICLLERQLWEYCNTLETPSDTVEGVIATLTR